MIDISTIKYKVIIFDTGGVKLDITDCVTNLGWEEGDRELAVRISMRLYNTRYKDRLLSSIVHPLTPIFIYAIIDGISQEVARGNVQTWSPTETNGTQSLEVTAYDEAIALRQNKENRYYTDGSTAKARLVEMFEQWGIPYNYQGPETALAKATFKNQSLADIVLKTLDDAKKKGAGFYFLRASGGKIEVLPRGTNGDIYHFDLKDNLVQTKDSFDATNVVTRVKVVGKSDKEGHQADEAIVDGKLSTYGWRQVIIERGEDKSLEDATKSAQEILKERGGMARRTSVEAPDLPFLRKGDRIRVNSETVKGYFFIKSIRHNAADAKMTMELSEDKERNRQEAEANGETYVGYDTIDDTELTGGEV